MSWRSRYQLSGNERSIYYTALITRFHIGIRRGARSFQLRGGFIEESENFEKITGVRISMVGYALKI
jgi:hypothetical protein